MGGALAEPAIFQAAPCRAIAVQRASYSVWCSGVSRRACSNDVWTDSKEAVARAWAERNVFCARGHSLAWVL